MSAQFGNKIVVMAAASATEPAANRGERKTGGAPIYVTDPLETWRHSVEVNRLRLVDPHEAKGQELDAIGQHRRAHRIRYCARDSNPRSARRLLGWKCKDAHCPSCAEKKARRKGWEVSRIVSALNSPRHFVAHALSRPYRAGDDKDATQALAAAVDEAYAAPACLRRLKFFRDTVRGGVVAPEVAYNERLHQWDFHFHFIIDGPDFDVARADAHWRKHVTRGSFIPDPRSIQSLKKLAFYVVKAKSWSPEAGVLGRAELAALTDVMRGKHRYRVWGVAKTAKVRLVDEPTASRKAERRSQRDARQGAPRLVWGFSKTRTKEDEIHPAPAEPAQPSASARRRDDGTMLYATDHVGGG